MYAFALGLVSATLPAAFAATWNVSVGANSQFRYDPQFIKANAGDVVNFIFHPKAHTVTQSSFDAPCIPMADGFDSGFQPVASETDVLPVKQFTVPPGSTALWFYCEQTGHCGKGMVFAINAPDDPDPHSFTQFQNLAISINGTNPTSSTSTSAASSTGVYVTPPPFSWQTATATVTQGSTWTITYSSYAGSSPPTAAPQPVDHRIIVGANGTLAYNPPNITASIGDTVTFEFHPKNHTVTQSSFFNPCDPLQESTPGSVGFKSGFKPVAANETNFPTFQIKINDTAPIWGYCGQTGHCGAGMVFSINAIESSPNNFSAFQDLAKHVGGATASGTGSTATSTSGAPSSTGGAKNGAVARRSSYGIMGRMVLVGGIVMMTL